MKLISSIILSLSTAGLYSCAQQVEKKEDALQSESDDNSELATSGGLELTQPKLDAFVRAKYYSIELSKAKCEPIDVSSKLGLESPLPSPTSEQDSQVKTPADNKDTDVADEVKPQKCEIEKYFAAKVPYVAGKILRVKALDGNTLVYVSISGETGVLLEGRAIVDVVGGRGKVNIKLLPPNSEPELIITTTVGGSPAPSPVPTPIENPYAEIKDYQQYPGEFVSNNVEIKAVVSMDVIRKVNLSRRDLCNVVVPSPEVVVERMGIQTSAAGAPQIVKDTYRFMLLKPGKIIFRCQSYDVDTNNNQIVKVNSYARYKYHVFYVK
ncbi:MAG: hypothetical protein NT027_04050 [Proteobacteria bacterium]|nr:hypothetical protein [Pseudomonadota bacterium]